MRLFDLIRASTKCDAFGFQIDSWYRNPDSDHFELSCGDTIEFHFPDQDVELVNGQCEATFAKVLGDEKELIDEGQTKVWIAFYVERMLTAEDVL